MDRPVIRGPYDIEAYVGTEFPEPSMTVQSEKDDADVNLIMERFTKHGVAPLQEKPPLFMDVSEMTDYRQVVEQVKLADEAFMELSAKDRASFGNDPAAFLDALMDPGRRSELQERGILAKDPPKAEEAPEPAKPA